MDRAVQFALASVLVGVTVLALKFGAYWLTGSVALYSDALESIINVAAAGAALVALHVSAKPADASHPFGHTKAEYFSAVVEGVLVVLAALSILREAYQGFVNPRALDAPWIGLAVSGAATALNLGWSVLLRRSGERLRSPALVADARHLMADVFTSLGVIVGVALVVLTGWERLDPALAALVALSVLWTGWILVRDSVSGLMDAAVPQDELDRIRRVVASYADGALEVHDLRTRHAGRATFVEFHLVVPADMTVAQAHDICDRIEDALSREVDGVAVTIHVEPEGKAKHHGVLVL